MDGSIDFEEQGIDAIAKLGWEGDEGEWLGIISVQRVSNKADTLTGFGGRHSLCKLTIAQ